MRAEQVDPGNAHKRLPIEVSLTFYEVRLYEHGSLTSVPPWSNNFNTRVQGIVAQFKPDLVISFTRATVRYVVATFSDGNFNLSMNGRIM